MLFLAIVAASLLLSSSASRDVCRTIEGAISRSSSVYYPGSANYTRDISHWSAASSQPSLCSVEPGSAKDVGTILRILGETRTKFGVKGGGHATNPGFSDTPGVQIAMYRFSQVEYDASTQTVAIGTGLIWDDVYAVLDPLGVNVVGGRVAGVGVAGFALGGGYSWLTNQHGLTIDTIMEIELVKPDGSVSRITHESDPALFFALKGTQNNFGIVTKLVLKAFPQGPVWGGVRLFAADQADAVKNATARFAHEVTDPKAGLFTAYNYGQGQMIPAVLLFYDAPTPPSGIFEDLVAIPAIEDLVQTYRFPEFVASVPGNDLTPGQAVFQTTPIVDYSLSILEANINETLFWGERLSAIDPGAFLSYNIEPFLPGLFSHNTHPTAYPPSRDVALFPHNLELLWSSNATDGVFLDAARQSIGQLANVAVAEGQRIVADAAAYPNYALFDTPVERIFGDNLPKLRAIKSLVDPSNVMGLAGGFKV
ncbi:FAD-binding domain-containing protein [Hymenopellis radicata]|nr:FAD-binding domain-containing protein [Hymenopellis radicata]